MLSQEDTVADESPWSDEITAYDRVHLKIYLRLLDAKTQGAEPDEVCVVLFGIDPKTDPARAQKAYDTHYRRAVWFTETGYRKLLQNNGPTRLTYFDPNRRPSGCLAHLIFQTPLQTISTTRTFAQLCKRDYPVANRPTHRMSLVEDNPRANY